MAIRNTFTLRRSSPGKVDTKKVAVIIIFGGVQMGRKDLSFAYDFYPSVLRKKDMENV